MKLNVNHPAYVLAFAGVVSAGFTAAIMALHAAAEPTVRRNARLFEQRALVEAFALDEGRPLTDEQVLAAYRRHVRRGRRIADPQTGTDFELIETVRTDPATGAEEAVGYAFAVWGVGFWARIDGYLAVTPDLGEVIGLVIVRHSETPGLGGRITEKAWRDAFRGTAGGWTRSPARRARPPPWSGCSTSGWRSSAGRPGAPASCERTDAQDRTTWASHRRSRVPSRRCGASSGGRTPSSARCWASARRWP
jgi:Na+-transporting NADH:ubiquinone oxidoreductase subunit C